MLLGGAWFQGAVCLVPGGCLTLEGVSTPGGVSALGGCLLLGGAWSWGGVSQHALRQTPQGEMVTAADGTHPTGMHSCLCMNSCVMLVKEDAHDDLYSKNSFFFFSSFRRERDGAILW